MQDAISAEPERDWDMAALAAVGHVTERHLLRLFIEHAGVSPLRYLQAIRLERARQSLEHGASVTRAAEVAGFRLGPAPAPRLEPAVGWLAWAVVGRDLELRQRILIFLVGYRQPGTICPVTLIGSLLSDPTAFPILLCAPRARIICIM